MTWISTVVRCGEFYTQEDEDETEIEEKPEDIDLLIKAFNKVMSENSDNADQGDQQKKSTKFLSKMALRLKSLLKDLLKAFVRKLHSLTRNYMFVSQVLSQEKKLLKVRL